MGVDSSHKGKNKRLEDTTSKADKPPHPDNESGDVSRISLARQKPLKRFSTAPEKRRSSMPPLGNRKGLQSTLSSIPPAPVRSRSASRSTHPTSVHPSVSKTPPPPAPIAQRTTTPPPVPSGIPSHPPTIPSMPASAAPAKASQAFSSHPPQRSMTPPERKTFVQTVDSLSVPPPAAASSSPVINDSPLPPLSAGRSTEDPIPGGADMKGGIYNFSLNSEPPAPAESIKPSAFAGSGVQASSTVKNEPSETVQLNDADILIETDDSLTGRRGSLPQKQGTNWGPLLDDPTPDFRQRLSTALSCLEVVLNYLQYIGRQLRRQSIRLEPVAIMVINTLRSNRKIAIGAASGLIVLLSTALALSFLGDENSDRPIQVAAAVPNRVEPAAHKPPNQHIEEGVAASEDGVAAKSDLTVHRSEELERTDEATSPTDQAKVAETAGASPVPDKKTMAMTTEASSSSKISHIAPLNLSKKNDDSKSERRRERRKSRRSKKKKEKAKPSSNTLFAKNGNKELPKRLSRDAVQSGMNKIARRVKKCAKKEHRPIVMSVTISKTGKVANAAATGSYIGTKIGNCVTKIVRTATFPPARQAITIKYPFHL